MCDDLKLKQDYLEEKKHLEECLSVIKKNIQFYEEKFNVNKAEIKELYDNYRSNNPELHSDLVMGLDWQTQLERTIRKNKLAVDKPYFGRIDYTEHDSKELPNNNLYSVASETKVPEAKFSLYIGKNGVAKDVSEVMIVDWRAPVSSVYYESDVGEGSYPSPEGDMIRVSLHLKRTYEIEKGKLIDYYDTDVISNDEFLTRYLAKNKEVVLGEIIATIQKEQNIIIRDTPWHTVIVQGVAGSGKTTVAMHRISYLLYNFKDKLRQDEFYIIGSNKTLLNYIVSVLPNLDVYHAHQMTMTELFLSLLEDNINIKKQKLKIQDILREENREGFKQLKGSLEIVKYLIKFLKEYEKRIVPAEDIYYQDDVLYARKDIEQLIDNFPMYPMQEKIEVLNKRIIDRVKTVNERNREEKEYTQKEVKKYKDYFGKSNQKINLLEEYTSFLRLLKFEWEEKKAEQKDVESDMGYKADSAIDYILNRIDNKILDLYDLALLCMIKKHLIKGDDFNFISHVVIDEAQDFGVSVFLVLRTLFPNCNYTIMGDISQNIYYDSGMNDWKALREDVFNINKDRFYVLSKSYRNTVEISDFAGSILKKCTFETYEIEPIIRHGKSVSINNVDSEQEMYLHCAEILIHWKKEGYDTMAVICYDMEEARKVQNQLKKHIEINILPEDAEEVKFVNGIMVLPIHLTKGLEFDTVMLFNPSEKNYPYNDASAKLLYVAVTRALHEFRIVCHDEISGLLTL